MSLESLGVADLERVIATFCQGLELHQGEVNALNVFPVPDGDTGTNMLATVIAVQGEIETLPKDREMASLCAAISKGSLMGARGNSGVILCQILRGLAEVLATNDHVDATRLSLGFSRASDAANTAVLRPVAGTILTVAESAANAASSVSGKSLLEVVLAARNAAIDVLAHTPEQLPVLAEAGVVDAGGAGLLLLFEAFSAVVGEVEMASALALPEPVKQLIATSHRPVEHRSPTAEPMLAYEVMYLLEAADDRLEEFKQAWGAIGDSIVVVGGEGLWNCHIHTDDIGMAIEAGIEVGRPKAIRVTDLRLEVAEEESWVLEASTPGDRPVVGPAPRTSVLAVASGAGLERIFASLGVGRVVAGGQSMNPSTKEILEAVNALPGQDVVLLPNNSNIVPVARQVAGLSPKSVQVIATAGVQEGFAALLAYDPGSSGEDNAKRMTEAAAQVVAGEVTQAVRAAPSSVGSVRAGDWIGLSRAGIEAVGASLSQATCALLEVLIGARHEIVTLIEGESCPRPEIEAVIDYLAKRHPEVNVERLLGGQPLYPLLVSIE